MCISATDFPLLAAAEMGATMGTFVESRMNFVAGSAMMEQNRAELYVDDQVWRRGGEGGGEGERGNLGACTHRRLLVPARSSIDWSLFYQVARLLFVVVGRVL